MSDSEFHRLVFGTTIDEPPKTMTFSCRFDVEVYSDISAIAQHFGTTKTFVAQTLLKSALCDFFATLDPKHSASIEGLSQAMQDQINEGK